MNKHATVPVFNDTLAVMLIFLFASSSIAILMLLLFTDPAIAATSLCTSGNISEGMTNIPLSKTKAQEALCNVVQKVPTTTQFGLITFNGCVFNLEPTQAKITGILPSEGTSPGASMNKVTDELLLTMGKNHGVGTCTLMVNTYKKDSYIMIAGIPTDMIPQLIRVIKFKQPIKEKPKGSDGSWWKIGGIAMIFLLEIILVVGTVFFDNIFKK